MFLDGLLVPFLVVSRWTKLATSWQANTWPLCIKATLIHLIWPERPAWPDSAKFPHFGKFFRVNLEFVKNLILLWQKCNGYWASFHNCRRLNILDNLAIWSHCLWLTLIPPDPPDTFLFFSLQFSLHFSTLRLLPQWPEYFIRKVDRTSVTRWLDYFSIFGHLQQ